MNHIFISYSRKDSEYVNAVTALLREAGLSVWQDISGKASGIPYSTTWFEVIQEALFSSAGAVIFTSEQWEKSDPCKKEFELYGKANRKYCSRECYMAERFGEK